MIESYISHFWLAVEVAIMYFDNLLRGVLTPGPPRGNDFMLIGVSLMLIVMTHRASKWWLAAKIWDRRANRKLHQVMLGRSLLESQDKLLMFYKTGFQGLMRIVKQLNDDDDTGVNIEMSFPEDKITAAEFEFKTDEDAYNHDLTAENELLEKEQKILKKIYRTKER